MLPIKVICPECMKEFGADPPSREYYCPECRSAFSG
jgi:DNA-directed RNA polymerase subunit RPC12/RpoP